MKLITTSGIFGNSYVARFAGFEFAPGHGTHKLALWATDMASAAPTLLLDLLQNPISVIAGDEGDVFVDLQLVQ